MNKLPHRQNLRLPDYDYSQAGAYFVTICTQEKKHLFGQMIKGEMRLNDAGRMVQSVWNEIPNLDPGIQIDEFIIMPNHIHGIISWVGADLRVRPGGVNRFDGTRCVVTGAHKGRPYIRWF